MKILTAKITKIDQSTKITSYTNAQLSVNYWLYINTPLTFGTILEPFWNVFTLLAVLRMFGRLAVYEVLGCARHHSSYPISLQDVLISLAAETS